MKRNGPTGSDSDEFRAPPGVVRFRRHWALAERHWPRASLYPELYNNYFILPMEVLKFLYSNGVFGHNMVSYYDNVLLPAVWNEFESIRHSPGEYIEFPANVIRTENPNLFVANEIKKLLNAEYREDLIYPTLVNRKETLRIPSHDVRDFPIALLIYILYVISKAFHEHPNRTVRLEFTTDTDLENAEWHIINGEHNYPIVVRNRKMKMTKLYKIYMRLMRVFAGFFPDGEGGNRDLRITWNGSEGSGTRIRMENMLRLHFLDLTLRCKRVRSGTMGGCWTQEVEDVLTSTIGRSVLSVRNRDNNKCLVYCVAMGLMIKYHPSGAALFGEDRIFIEDYEICAKGTFMFSKDDEVSKNIQRLIMTTYPVSDGGEASALFNFVQDIDHDTSLMQSVMDLRKKFGEIEGKLLSPSILCGLDVYGVDYNINPHIYPIYMTKNRVNVISLLCVTPPQTSCSHFCVIKNLRTLLRESGGKQFFGCPRCGQSFYHKRLLGEHHCPMRPQPFVVPGDGGYHYSKIGIIPEIDIVCGVCPKCRLAFVSEFEFEYHKAHCLMAGKTGYRHVQLVSYKVGDHPLLKGESVDMEAENKFISNSRIMYADFECSINPETGLHTFMSYGIYDCKDEIYQCGYDLQEFLDFILEKAFLGDEEHIYVYFHNAMGYDASFVLRHVMKKPEYVNWGIQVIMKSMNKLQKLVFYVKKDDKSRTIHIGDTFLFLTMSLDGIVKCVKKETLEGNEEAFPRFFEVFKLMYPHVSNEEINHILRKNIFPYKFFTDSSKLDTPIDEFMKIFEARKPNLEYFSDKITVDDLIRSYPDTKHVIETFRCKSARDYHDIYLCCDVMELADVFEHMQEVIWDSHHIHLRRYLGMPSATWAAFLRDDPTLELPLYENTFFAEFFKASVRGGVTSAPLRYAVVKSDQKRMEEVPAIINGADFGLDYNISKESFFAMGAKIGIPTDKTPKMFDGEEFGLSGMVSLDTYMELFKAFGIPGFDETSKYSMLYLDVNGLYPYVMQKYDYPCGFFKFNPMGYTGSLCKIKLNEIFKELERIHHGMWFCVDLHIPDSVKEKTDMYPFAPEHRRIYAEYFQDNEQHIMTPFLKKWSEANHGEKMSEFMGLVCTLYDKKQYNVHWKLLKFYIEHGVEVKKVYFSVEFDEKPYLHSYIAKNIERRNKCGTAFLKMLFKLMNNAVYGKTMEDVLRRVMMEIVRDPTKLEGLIEEGNVSAVLPIEDLGWIVKMNGEDVILDKPTYVGATILEYAKLHMYTLLYDKIMPIFPDQGEEKGVQLIYTDTDSFIVKVRHPDGIRITNPKELFAYIKSKDPDLIGPIGGQIKSETGEDTIREVMAIRSKVYAFLTLEGEYVGHAKGTTMEAQELQLDWMSYWNVLFRYVSKTTSNAVFERIRFLISSGLLNKVSLSANDGKRYICKDGIRTYAFGNPKILEDIESEEV